MIAANKREKEARLAAARKSKEREDLAKARKVQERKAAEEERRQFVDEAVAAYEKAMSDKTKAKDGEMKQMMQMIEEEQERRRTWFDKQWNEMQAVEDKAARSLEMSRAASSGETSLCMCMYVASLHRPVAAVRFPHLLLICRRTYCLVEER